MFGIWHNSSIFFHEIWHNLFVGNTAAMLLLCSLSHPPRPLSHNSMLCARPHIRDKLLSLIGANDCTHTHTHPHPLAPASNPSNATLAALSTVADTVPHSVCAFSTTHTFTQSLLYYSCDADQCVCVCVCAFHCDYGFIPVARPRVRENSLCEIAHALSANDADQRQRIRLTC